jgi:hypothetical protein
MKIHVNISRDRTRTLDLRDVVKRNDFVRLRAFGPPLSPRTLHFQNPGPISQPSGVALNQAVGRCAKPPVNLIMLLVDLERLMRDSVAGNVEVLFDRRRLL